MAPKRIELDPVFDALNPVGKYQVTQTTLFFISYFSCSYSLFSIVFTGQRVEHSCAPAPNDTTLFASHLNGDDSNATELHYGQCSIDVITNVSGNVIHEETACLYGMQYNKPRDFSVRSEFDLVCGRVSLTNLSQTLLMLGQAIGASLFTSLSDRYGRKRIQVITHVLLISGSIVIGFAPDYITFALFKLLVGAVQQGVVLTTVTANVESFPRRYRGFVAGFIGTLYWGLQTSTFTAWAYALRDFPWRILQLASTTVGLVVIIQIIFLREPMRWLMANGRTHEVMEQLKKAAKVNNRNLKDALEVFRRVCTVRRNRNINAVSGDVITQTDDAANDDGDAADLAVPDSALFTQQTEVEENKTERLSFLDMFGHKRMRTNTLCLWAIWFINSLTFFALILMSGTLTSNIYLSFFLNIVVEIPAAFIFMIAVDRIGRRRMLLMFHAIAAFSLLISGVLISFKDSDVMQTLAVVMSLIGKLGISGSFNAVFFFTPEIFPTNIRNLAVGTGSTAARIGGMIAPFIGDLANLAVWAPGALFGTCNLLILVLIRVLPDSMGKELPQTLSDLDAWYDEVPANDETKKKGKKAKATKLETLM